MHQPLSNHLTLSRSAALMASVALFLCSTSVRATSVLDTFGPGDSATGGNWSLYNPTLPVPEGAQEGQSLAVPFSLADVTTIDSILTSISGAGSYGLYIVADAAGLPTGAILYSTTLTDPTANVLVTGVGVTLAAGDYWLAAKAAYGSGGAWRGGGVAGTRPWAFTFSAVDTNWVHTVTDDAPAARITAVPEPGAWALMVGGVALLVGLARRRAR